MRIVVTSPGMLTTIQDLGRAGHGIQGVSRAGAADALALRVGNRLLGNPEGAAALEMTLLGGTFAFPDGARIVLTGARPAAMPVYQRMEMAPGEECRLGAFVAGARCYLCVAGGIDAPLTAGSASTHLPSGLGPAPLRKGDTLRFHGGGAGSGRVPEELTRYETRIRVTRGAQWAQCNEEVFYASEYEVTTEANRMGLRLAGPAAASGQNGQMVTEGVPLGAIQIPSNGQPILLFVDQQTTGGYPKIANVISADLPNVAQLRPRDRVRFQLVSPEEARRALLGQEELIRRI